jgi:quercetin dioxygenase-like cupin family protein
MLTHLNNFKNGWFIGNFEPSLNKTSNFEIGLHHYKKGFIGPPHIHKVATEYNLIVSGEVKLAGNLVLKEGAIFVFGPGQYMMVEFLEDTTLVIVKTPSVPNDKYLLQSFPELLIYEECNDCGPGTIHKMD